MVKIRTSRTKQPPKDYAKVKKTLDDFEIKLKQIHVQSIKKTSSSSNEALWDIFRINHQKSRYIYELYYKKKVISKDLYDWLLKQRIIDANLIAKWRKQGYEHLCCLKCIQTTENNNGSTCICRVPKATLEKNEKIHFTQCINCGCHGCASSD